jgi:hypothetical protein
MTKDFRSSYQKLEIGSYCKIQALPRLSNESGF